MRAFGIRTTNFSLISNAELDELVWNVVLLHPPCGEGSVTGYVRSQGHHIERERIRQSTRCVDPVGVEARARGVLHRKRYPVEAPNSMWHLHGYHKLIRWNIVIHGALMDRAGSLFSLEHLPTTDPTQFYQHFVLQLKNMDYHLVFE